MTNTNRVILRVAVGAHSRTANLLSWLRGYPFDSFYCQWVKARRYAANESDTSLLSNATSLSSFFQKNVIVLQFALIVRLLQLSENPGFGKRPMTMSGRRGNIENLGRFAGAEAREITQLHDRGFHGEVFREVVQ